MFGFELMSSETNSYSVYRIIGIAWGFRDGDAIGLVRLDFLTPLTSFDALRRVANTPVEFESYLDLTVDHTFAQLYKRR
jgi:hypothetical protein